MGSGRGQSVMSYPANYRVRSYQRVNGAHKIHKLVQTLLTNAAPLNPRISFFLPVPTANHVPSTSPWLLLRPPAGDIALLPIVAHRLGDGLSDDMLHYHVCRVTAVTQNLPTSKVTFAAPGGHVVNTGGGITAGGARTCHSRRVGEELNHKRLGVDREV